MESEYVRTCTTRIGNIVRLLVDEMGEKHIVKNRKNGHEKGGYECRREYVPFIIIDPNTLSITY